MYSVTKTEEKYIWNLHKFTADSESDIKDLPTDKDKIRPGSTCICIAESSIWVLDHNYQWRKMSIGKLLKDADEDTVEALNNSEILEILESVF